MNNKLKTMRKFIYLFVLLCSSLLLQGQCTAIGMNFGNNTATPMYNVQGGVTVILNTNNTITLETGANFSTAAGPDVRVYLVDRGMLTDAALTNTFNFPSLPKIEMGIISGNGAMSFTQNIPSSVTIADFDTIYFLCEDYSLFWDFGSYAPFTSNNCSVLSNTVFNSEKITVFPNPVNDVFFIKGQSDIVIERITIYNSLGQKVWGLNKNIEAAIDVSGLKHGIYYVEIIDKEGNTSIKNIIKRV